MAKKWECRVCLYLHEGDEAPDKCPVCGAPKSEFYLDDYEPQNEPRNEPQSKPQDKS